LYEQLLALQKQGSHPDLSCSHLTLDSVVLPNVLVIQTGSKHLLYIPEDPVTPFRLHLHMSDLESELAARLDKSLDYRKFFK
ncbi:dermonecrotic toxin domain-containing protein, partial [Klebsiella pneumoniae]